MTSWQRRGRVHLRRAARRVRTRLSETSRVMIVGVLVFLTGFGLSLLRPPESEGEGGRVSIVHTVNKLVDTANAWLPSRLTDPETRERVNILMVAMLSESLPPAARERLEGMLTSTRSFFGNLFTLTALLTLIPVIGLYFLLARWMDRRGLAGPPMGMRQPVERVGVRDAGNSRPGEEP